MRSLKSIGAGLTLSVVFLLATDAKAQGTPEATRAKQLLHNAVTYYRDQGDAALAAFSRQGEFIDGEHYVFVVDTHGTMLASGGSSAVLIGRDVSNALEPELRRAFQQALAAPENGRINTAEYRWMNVRDGRVERKQVYYQRYKDRIIAVGVYLPRATPEQAQGLLVKATSALETDPKSLIKAINGLSADYREDDLYVFVVDLSSQRYVAHGYNPRLLGVDFGTIHDSDGKPVGAPILALMSKSNTAEFDYRWKNPVTSKVEDKHALVSKVGHYILAVGYYQNPR
ncbi:cache domain-containing protein [Pseudomonas sp. MMS21-TM103]|uniref:cache domain-containing protein n=1 Tax=Pseudomonas sp. MMS21 TM103 TaxID=2886506 RepID=UPI001EE00D01|nr:cache domain-containing protein [Pseudomonas sp. MMS21 TM103]MCG4454910.1 cache domain-containing protein [Pseudomonas sp. MMS21 TM103]